MGENSVSPYLSELAYVRLARVLIILDKSEEALQVLDDSEFSEASQAMVKDARGDVLISLQEHKEALKAYQDAWEASPYKPEFLRIKLMLLGQSPK